jgi:hypothetical protein
VKYKSTSGSIGRIQDVREALKILVATSEDIGLELQQLSDVKVSDAELDAFLDLHANGAASLTNPKDGTPREGRSLTMATNRRNAHTDLWDNDSRVSPWRNTGLGVVQMVSTFNHHKSIVRNVDRPERNLLSAIDGTTARSDAAVISDLEKVLAKA